MWARRGKVDSVTRRPLAATAAVMAQMEAGGILDPGDLVAAYAREISAALDPQVAELGDQLDDCESELESRNKFRLRTRDHPHPLRGDRLPPLRRARPRRAASRSPRWISTGSPRTTSSTSARPPTASPA